MTVIGQRAYIGSFTAAGGRGVTVAAVDPATGALRELTRLPEAPENPSYLALAPDGRTLYAAGENAAGTVQAFSLADPDRPRPLAPPVPVDGDSPTHLTATTRRVYTANYGSGSVSAVPLADGARPGGPAHVTRHHGSGPVTDRQAGPHAHGVLVDPGSSWLLATDLGTDSVWIYRLDPADGGHRPHGEQPLRPGTGPRHLAFHPGGTTVHVLHELEPVLTHCRWDPAAGRLTVLGETPVPAGGRAGEDFPSGLVISPDGTRLYAAVRGADQVAVVRLGGADGAAEPLGTVDCGGAWPRALALDPGGRRLYVANERSGDVTWFELPEDGGLPRRAGALPAPAASCVVFG